MSPSSPHIFQKNMVRKWHEIKNRFSREQTIVHSNESHFPSKLPIRMFSSALTDSAPAANAKGSCDPQNLGAMGSLYKGPFPKNPWVLTYALLKAPLI